MRTNAAWTRFALENDGQSVLERWTNGASIDDAIPEPLRPFYFRAFDEALASGERWEHEYDCSSPQRYRRFRMVLVPVEATYLIAVHAIVVEQAHSASAQAADPAHYVADGVIHMCSHCRRVQNHAGRDRWDWVPMYLTSAPVPVSHGLCALCFAYYYGG